MEHEHTQSQSNQQNIPNNSSTMHHVSDEDTMPTTNLSSDNSLLDE